MSEPDQKSSPPCDGSAQDPRLDDVLADYLRRIAAGEVIDRERFIAEHSDVADKLRQYFETADLIQQVAAPAARFDPAINHHNAATLQANSFGGGPPTAQDATPDLGSWGPNAQSLSPSSSFSTRLRYFGDYELIEEIARGGMGVVYKARQVSLNRIVAVKMILVGQLASDADVKRFRTEAEAAANLDHPNIVSIYEVGEHEGQHYFSMKFVDGPSLSHKVSQFVTSPRLVARMLAMVARAVHHAHQRGILHRDLKPSNVLLQLETDRRFSPAMGIPNCEAFTPIVTDFGLAKRCEGSSELTHTGVIMGTPSYMPPEQASGKAKAVTTASDVYSLGAILYELLTGRPPFRGDSSLETLIQVMERDPLRPRAINPHVNHDLETIALKCLEKDALNRYGSAAELADDLERWLLGEPIHARPTTAWERAGKWAKRHPAVAGLIGGIVLVSVAGLIGIIGQWRNAVRARAAANEQRVAALDAASRAVTAKQEEEAQRLQAQSARENAESALKEAQKALYFNLIALAEREWSDSNVSRADAFLSECPPELRHWEWKYLRRLHNSSLLTVREPAGLGNRLVFSPDGAKLALATGDKTVKLWDVNAGKPLLVLRGHMADISDIQFTLDGSFIAASGRNLWADRNVLGEIKIWPSTGGEPIWSTQGTSKGILSIAFSPDNQQIAALSVEGLKIWNWKTGTLIGNVNRAISPVSKVLFTPSGPRVASLEDASVQIWDGATGAEIARVQGPRSGTAVLAFSADGAFLAAGSGGFDRVLEIRVAQISTGREIALLKGRVGTVTGMDFSSDSKYLAAVRSDPYKGEVTIWDLSSGEQVCVRRGLRGPPSCVAFSPDGRRVAAADQWSSLNEKHAEMKIWSVKDEEEAIKFSGHPTRGHAIAFSPMGDRIASADNRKSAKIWDIQTGRELATLPGRWTVAFSPHGERIASVGETDLDVVVWQADSGKELWRGRGHTGKVSCVAFSPDGASLASAGWDNTVRIWDAEGQELKKFVLPSHVHWVSFSPDGGQLATAESVPGCVIRLWDLATGENTGQFRGHTHSIYTAQFSPNGKLIASASDDGTIRVWDVDSRRELYQRKGHLMNPTCIAWSHDAKRIASGSWDKTVRIWESESGREIIALRGHRGLVFGVAFSPKSDWLASVGGDVAGEVLLWDARPLEK